MILLIVNVLIPLYVATSFMLLMHLVAQTMFNASKPKYRQGLIIAFTWPIAILTKQGRNKLNKYYNK